MMPITLPDPFGPFRIVRKLGSGGMGDVYLAHDTRLGRAVALKVPHFGACDDPQVAERFQREARVAAQVPPHPGLCAVHEVGSIDGIHFLAMAYIEGQPLARYLGEAAQWHPVHAIALVAQLAQALYQLHQRGIVHRDLKASNVILQTDGRAVLLDFGLARSFVSVTQQVTLPGQVLGTPGTMAPEQLTAEEGKIGPATDIWALGVLLYQLLTGRSPFGQGNPHELGMRILCLAVTPPSQLRPGLDPRLDRLCALALAKNPSERPANGQVFYQMLQQLQMAPPDGRWVAPPTPLSSRLTLPTAPVKRLSLIGLGALSVVLIGLIVGLALGRLRESDPTATATTTTTTAAARDNPLPPPTLPPAPPEPSLMFQQPPPLTVTAGESASCAVQIERRHAEGAIELLVIDDKKDLHWQLPTLPAGNQVERITVQTTATTEPGRRTLRLVAIEANGAFTETVVTLVVLPAPAPELLVTVPDALTLRVGQAITFPLTLERRHFQGNVRVTQKNQVDGVRLNAEPIETDKQELVLRLVADSTAAPGRHTLEIRAAAANGLVVVRTILLTIQPPAALPRAFVNSIGMKLVLIPQGKTTIGSSRAEQAEFEKGLRALRVMVHSKPAQVSEQAIKDFMRAEGPQHTVTIGHDFYCAVYEVTQQEFTKVVMTNPSQFQVGGLGVDAVKGLDTTRFPVETVSWEAAVDFCAKLSNLPAEKKAGRSYRLPTSAEWEYACRGGSSTYQYYHVGDALDSTQANIIGTRPFGTTTQGDYLKRPTTVGSYKPNGYGLYDMHGNVWEWCSDWYDDKYYSNTPAQDPQGPQNGVFHVRRGGSWHTQAIFCRSAFRMGLPVEDDNRIGHIGFRVVCVQAKPQP